MWKKIKLDYNTIQIKWYKFTYNNSLLTLIQFIFFILFSVLYFFSYIEKIKSTGATYMAASGLTAQTCDLINYKHITAMADYALQLFDKIEEVNMHSFNNFRMRIGECKKGIIFNIFLWSKGINFVNIKLIDFYKIFRH